MKKSDLKNGMIVKLRNGERYMLIDFKGEMWFIGQKEIGSIREYGENLKNQQEEFDIMEVYDQEPRPLRDITNVVGRVIWRRGKETKEITAAEAFRVLREHYGQDVKIMEG